MKLKKTHWICLAIGTLILQSSHGQIAPATIAELCRLVWVPVTNMHGQTKNTLIVQSSRKGIDHKGLFTEPIFQTNSLELYDIRKRILAESTSFLPCFEQAEAVAIMAPKIKLMGNMNADGKSIFLVAQELELGPAAAIKNAPSVEVFYSQAAGSSLLQKYMTGSAGHPSRVHKYSDPFANFGTNKIVDAPIQIIHAWRNMARGLLKSEDKAQLHESKQFVAKIESALSKRGIQDLLQIHPDEIESITQDQVDLLSAISDVGRLKRSQQQNRNLFGLAIDSEISVPPFFVQQHFDLARAARRIADELAIYNSERLALLNKTTEDQNQARRIQYEVESRKISIAQQELLRKSQTLEIQAIESVMAGLVNQIRSLTEEKSVREELASLVADLRTNLPERSPALKGLNILNSAISGGASGAGFGGHGTYIGAGIGLLGGVLNQDYEDQVQKHQNHNAEIQKRMQMAQGSIDLIRTLGAIQNTISQLQTQTLQINASLEKVKITDLEISRLHLEIKSLQENQENLFVYSTTAESLDDLISENTFLATQLAISLRENLKTFSKIKNQNPLTPKICESISQWDYRTLRSCISMLSHQLETLAKESTPLGASSNSMNIPGEDIVTELILSEDTNPELFNLLKDKGSAQFGISSQDQNSHILIENKPHLIQSIFAVVIPEGNKIISVPLQLERINKTEDWYRGPKSIQAVSLDLPSHLNLSAISTLNSAHVIPGKDDPSIPQQARSFFAPSAENSAAMANRSPEGKWEIRIHDPLKKAELMKAVGLRIIFFLRIVH